MSIGGVLSAAAVAVRLAGEEQGFLAAGGSALSDPALAVIQKKDVGAARYVDDILACSRGVCSVCVGRCFQGVYSEKLSTV